jgi:hypothetical protein
LQTAPLSSPSIRLLDSISCAPERSFYTGFCGEPIKSIPLNSLQRFQRPH